MLSVFDIAYVGNASLKEKFKYLESCNHLQSFVCESSKSLENVTSKVKSLLESPSTRTEGLMLLHTLLEQCSSEVFVDNALFWAQTALKILQGHDTCGNKHLSCKILVSILKHLPSFSEIWSLSSTSLVPAVLETLLKTSHEDEWVVTVMDCLAQCMQHFPGACGQSKTHIEQFLLLQLDNWYVRSVEPVAKCIALLPSCGGGGSKGINYATSWQEQIDKLISTLHQILNTLYEGVEISDEEYLDAVGIEFSSQPEDPFSSILKQSQRFQVVSLCVVKMLSNHFPVKVKIPTEAIISLICRVLSVNTAILTSRPTTEQAAVVSVLPVIYSSVLCIMEALIMICQKILIPHSTLVMKLLVQVLKSTQAEKISVNFEKPFGMVHSSIYRVLQVWLTRLGPCSSVELYADQLVCLLMSDIKPEVNVWKTYRSSNSIISESNRGQKRKRKSSALTASNQEMEIQKINHIANHTTCTEALKALKWLLYAGGCLMKPDILKEVYDVIIHLIIGVQQKHNNPPIPYSNASCRQELYAVLLAILLNSHSLHPPPVQVAVNLFRSGQRDQNILVSNVCIEALAACDAIIHPRVSALQHVSVPKLLMSRSMKIPLFPSLGHHLNGEVMSENAEWPLNHNNAKILNRSKPLCPIQTTLVEKETTPPSEERVTIPEVENNRPNVPDDGKHKELSVEENDVVTYLPSQEEHAVMNGSEGDGEEEFTDEHKVEEVEDGETVACLQLPQEVSVAPSIAYDITSTAKPEKSTLDVSNEEAKENGLETAVTDSLPELDEMDQSEIHPSVDENHSASPKTEHLTNNIENHSSSIETDVGIEIPTKKHLEERSPEEFEDMNVEAMLQDFVPASPDHPDNS